MRDGVSCACGVTTLEFGATFAFVSEGAQSTANEADGSEEKAKVAREGSGPRCLLPSRETSQREWLVVERASLRREKL